MRDEILHLRVDFRFCFVFCVFVFVSPSTNTPVLMSTASKETTPIVFEWLERIGLGYAVPNFKARGIVNPKALTALNIKDYEDLQVSDLADRKRLYELVQRVRLASKSVKQRKPASGGGGGSSDSSSTSSSSGGDGSSSSSNGSNGSSSRAGVSGTSYAGSSSGKPSTGTSSSSSSIKSTESATATRQSSENKNPSSSSSSALSNGYTGVSPAESKATLRHSTGSESAREILRKKRAQQRVRRLTQSPATDNDVTAIADSSDSSINNNDSSIANRKSISSISRPSARVKMVRAPRTDTGTTRTSSGNSDSGGGRRGNRYAQPAEPEVPERAPASEVRLSSSQAFASERGTAADILSLDPDETANAMAAKIRVVVRKRPLSRKERSRDDMDIVDMDDDHHMYVFMLLFS